VETTERGIRSVPVEGTGSHVALDILPWSAEVVLVQLEVRTAEPVATGATEHSIESRFLSLESGAELYRTTTLPHIVAVHGENVYALQDDPYPQLWILRRRERP
ncbi:MAG: hypothetical protein ACRELX_08590, partial [Longimicrobiales bacterium]